MMDVPHLAKKDFVLRWPEPAQVRLDQEIKDEEPCEVEFRSGAKHLGALLHFTGIEPFFVFRPHSNHPLHAKKISVRLSNIRQLILTRPVSIIPIDMTSLNDSGAIVSIADPQIYNLEFFDSAIVSGETVAYVRSEAGLFLYSPKAGNQVIRSFVPETSIAYLQLGDPIGRILVEEHAVSEMDLADALEKQQKLRGALLGDYLIEEGFITQAELEQALAFQKERPSLRLGEALVELGLLTNEALHMVLARQRSERGRPLGEILVEMGALDTQTLTKAWAKKLGLPYIDLEHVSVHPSVIDRLSARDAHALMALPLAVGKDCLTIAVAGPADMSTLSELSLLTGMRVMTLLASPDQIRGKLAEYYPETVAWDDRPIPEAAVSPSIPSESADSMPEVLRRVFEEGETADLTDPVELPSDLILKELLVRMMSNALWRGELHLSVESGATARHLTIRFRKDTVPS